VKVTSRLPSPVFWGGLTETTCAGSFSPGEPETVTTAGWPGRIFAASRAAKLTLTSGTSRSVSEIAPLLAAEP
jgi:hypothetical protein